jgi:hypothetical protein
MSRCTKIHVDRHVYRCSNGCCGPHTSWHSIGCTATKIPFMYSISGNSAASAPISTFMCRWASYIALGSAYIFPPAEKADQSWEYIIALTDAWMWKLGPRPRYSSSGNICFEISVFCLCRVALNRYYTSRWSTHASRGIIGCFRQNFLQRQPKLLEEHIFVQEQQRLVPLPRFAQEHHQNARALSPEAWEPQAGSKTNKTLA